MDVTGSITDLPVDGVGSTLLSLRERSLEGSQEFATTSETEADELWMNFELEIDSFSTSTQQPSLLSSGPACGPSRVLIYDTTLRDGSQMESVSVSWDNKLKIAKRLSQFEVNYVEAGWPGSNPKDEEFFRSAET